jgi:hypothetical protein
VVTYDIPPLGELGGGAIIEEQAEFRILITFPFHSCIREWVVLHVLQRSAAVISKSLLVDETHLFIQFGHLEESSQEYIRR